jgi:hypothetical protein
LLVILEGVRAFAPALLTLSILHSHARADDDIDEGRRLFDQARFEDAIAAFDRAAAGDRLSRAELVELLEARALAHHANGDPDAAERDLTALLAVSPDYELTRAAPPALRRRFEGIEPARFSVHAEASTRGDRTIVSTTVDGDVELVREVRVHSRRARGEWRTDRGERVEIDGAEWWVEVIGPGGAAIASVASASDPRVIEEPIVAATPIEEDDGASPWPWILLGGGLALAAGAAVLVYFLLTPTEFAVSAPHPVNP